MSKVRNKPLPKNKENDEGVPVGLSYSPKVAENIFIQKMANGEVLISAKRVSSVDYVKSDPPIRCGGIEQKGMSRKAKSKVRKAIRQMQYLVENDRNYRGYVSFVTLPYPKEFPDDLLAKRHLGHMIKRLKRALGDDFMFLWIIEKQKRGAPHFHFLTPEFIPKELLNKLWSDIVRKWYESKGLEFKLVLPNIQKAENIAKYMTKYMTKESQPIKGNTYNMSANLRALLVPVAEFTLEVPEDCSNDIIKEALNSYTDIYYKGTYIFGHNLCVWMPDAKDIILRLREQTIRYESEIE